MPGPKPKLPNNRTPSKGRVKAKDVFKALEKNAEGRRKGKVRGQRTLPPAWQAAKDARIPGKPPQFSSRSWFLDMDVGIPWWPQAGIPVKREREGLLEGDFIQAAESKRSPDVQALIDKIISTIGAALGIPVELLTSPEQNKMADDPKKSSFDGIITVQVPMSKPRPMFMSMGLDYGYNPPRDTRTDAERERDELKRNLDIARQDLKRQNDMLQKLASAAHAIATVVEINDDKTRMTISDGGRQIDVSFFAGCVVGSRVACNQDTMQVLQVLPRLASAGQLGTVKALIGNKQVEIDGDTGMGGRVLRVGLTTCEVGDQIIYDMNSSIVLENLGKPKSQLAWEQPTNVSWDDIGGHEEAKKALRDAIETPVLHAERFKRYGRRPTKGVLLYGPPGTGKTLLAKAAATSLAQVHGREVAAGFIYVKGPELLSKWVGESESGIRALFKNARDHKKKHGYPAVVFIDEAESILGRRGDSGRSFMTQTLVPQFLAEMDGLEDSGCLLILATNRAGDLDPAVTREGRIDRKVHVDRPKQDDTRRIAEIHLKGRPTGAETDLASLASLVSVILHTEPTGKLVGPAKTVPITLSSFSSGAMIAGIVEEAATNALNRDIENGTDSGITPEDIRVGVQKATEGLMALDHSGVLQEILAQNPEVFTGHIDEHKIALGKSEEGMSN